MVEIRPDKIAAGRRMVENGEGGKVAPTSRPTSAQFEALVFSTSIYTVSTCSGVEGDQPECRWLGPSERVWVTR
jgi:hypothetical protein